MRLIFITDHPCVALNVAQAGVDAVMVDLEINGKIDRQGHLNSVISKHMPEAVSTVSNALQKTPCITMVRLNPVYDGTEGEVEESLARGAQRLMLPMFRQMGEVKHFLSVVDGRVPVTLLVETVSAYARLREILQLKGDYDIHVGLNDLHLEMKLDFMFELLTCGVVEHIAAICKKAGRQYGIGGVARLGGGGGALSAEDILAEHLRLGSSAVILSRDWRHALDDGKFADGVSALRSFLVSTTENRSHETGQKVSLIAQKARDGYR